MQVYTCFKITPHRLHVMLDVILIIVIAVLVATSHNPIKADFKVPFFDLHFQVEHVSEVEKTMNQLTVENAVLSTKLDNLIRELSESVGDLKNCISGKESLQDKIDNYKSMIEELKVKYAKAETTMQLISVTKEEEENLTQKCNGDVVCRFLTTVGRWMSK